MPDALDADERQPHLLIVTSHVVTTIVSRLLAYSCVMLCRPNAEQAAQLLVAALLTHVQGHAAHGKPCQPSGFGGHPAMSLLPRPDWQAAPYGTTSCDTS